MLQALLARLRLTYEDDGIDVKDYALKIQERQNLRADLQQLKDEKENELNQIAEMESEMDMMDAMDPGETGEGEKE